MRNADCLCLARTKEKLQAGPGWPYEAWKFLLYHSLKSLMQHFFAFMGIFILFFCYISKKKSLLLLSRKGFWETTKWVILPTLFWWTDELRLDLIFIHKNFKPKELWTTLQKRTLREERTVVSGRVFKGFMKGEGAGWGYCCFDHIWWLNYPLCDDKWIQKDMRLPCKQGLKDVYAFVTLKAMWKIC